ncbi:MAG: hypothetical protein J7K21_05565 [Desulfurococcales archaeon]|nr:hypothetical protein [Desulfurococcales archaeon]
MYILALDTGKTKTVAVLVDGNLDVRGYSVTGPADIILDKDIVLNNIRDAVVSCVKKAGMDLGEVDLIVISWAGLDTRSDFEIARSYAREIGLPAEKTYIIHDAVSALYAVTWGRPGIAVIAGTGAIAYGINREGRTTRSSGWGWFIGDEGSGSWISLQALNAASRAYDGRGEYTSLVERIADFFGVDDLLDIISIIYHRRLFNDISAIAKIATIVDEEAARGDKVSREIMEVAGKELALSAYSVAKRLGMENEEIIVGGVGSVFKSRFVRESFEKHLRQLLPSAVIKEPIIGYQAILGSIIYALRRLGYRVEEEIVNKIVGSIKETT